MYHIQSNSGTNGSVSKGTKVVLPVKTGNTREVDFSRWRAFVHSQTDNTLVVEVCTNIKYELIYQTGKSRNGRDELFLYITFYML